MDDKMTNPRLCGHCNNKLPFILKAEYSHRDEEHEPIGEVDIIVKAYTDIFYRLFECPTCHEPTLELEYEWFGRTDNWEHDMFPDLNSGQFESYGFSTKKILYPREQVETSHIPARILSRYREALKVRHNSPPAFAAMAGRTLEAIYKHENENDKDAFKVKLNNLVNKGRIPQSLFDTVIHIYKLRNLGAHDDATQDVTEDDVPIILDFLNALLEYLYVAPAKIAAIQARISESTSTSTS